MASCRRCGGADTADLSSAHGWEPIQSGDDHLFTISHADTVAGVGADIVGGVWREACKGGIECPYTMPHSPLVVIDGGVLHLPIDKSTLHNGGIARISHLAIAMHGGGGDIGSGESENYRHIGTCKIDGAKVVGLDSVTHTAKADITAVVQ